MSTKMKKGILRPFRYISNMMDGKEAAQDMQIGFPTDVKHVAHIGWDGPSVPNNNNNTAGAPSWMKDYHSAPLDSASFRSDRGGSAAANPWASQEIVVDGGSLGDTSFSETRSEASGSMDITAGDSPPSPDSRRSRRHRSRGSAATCQDLPAVPKKSNRRKNKGGSEGTGAAAASKADGAGAGGEDAAAPEPPATEEAQDHD